MQDHQRFCEFCKIYTERKQNDLIIAEDEAFFAFHDIDNGSAQAHILICTKQHVQSIMNLKSANTVLRMQQFGYSVLQQLALTTQKRKLTKQECRFGFHVPPHISVYHIHLHCFILPFENKLCDLVRYGFGPIFKSVEEAVSLIFKKQAKL